MTHTSVKRTMRLIDSDEFTEWQAFYALEAEALGAEHEPTNSELSQKLLNWAQAHSAKEAKPSQQ